MQCDVFLLIIPQKLDRQTAFHMACEQGAMPIVQYLVDKDPAVCRITLVDCRGKTPLHMAAKRNHAHLVSFLLEKVSPFSLLSTFLLVMKCDETLSHLFDLQLLNSVISNPQGKPRIVLNSGSSRKPIVTD